MPLIPSKSKKAFSKNIETEMHAGKPQKQSIAIAYSVKKKAGKKYAKGGMVNESAASEHRPMPEEKDKDAAMVSRNSGDKAPKNDSWVGRPTVSQAQSNNGRMVKPIKRPSMVPSNAFSTRMYDEEADLQSSAKTGPYDAQPPQHDDEEGPDRQGPKVSDMQDEHSTKRKPYAKGGQVQSSDYSHKANKYEDDLLDIPPSEDEGDMLAMSHNEVGADRHGDEVPDMEHEHNNGRKPYASGGQVMPPAREDKGWGAVIMKAAGGEVTERAEHLDSQEPIHESHPDSQEDEIMHAASIAAAIMAKRRMMAKGGEILSHGSMESDDSSQADLSRNADEDANEEDQSSFNALRKENYNESEGLAQLDSPSDSNEDGRDIDHDKRDMLSDIRAKMKRRIR